MYTRPATIPKSNKIIDDLNELAKLDTAPELELMRIKKEAEKLKPVDIYGYYLILGILAVMKQDPDSMFAAHENAIKVAVGSDLVDAYGNYAVSLNKLGFRNKSYEYMKKAYSYSNGNLDFAYELVDSAIKSGNFYEAIGWAGEYEKLVPDGHHDQHEFLSEIHNVLCSTNMSDENTSACINAAHTLLIKKGIYKFSELVSVHEDDGSPWISFVVRTNETLDKVLDLDFELYDTLGSMTESYKTGSALSIRYATKEEENGDRTQRVEAVSA